MFTPAFVFFFLSVSAVALFTFVGVAVWTGARTEERKALYRTELLKKLSEGPGEGARQVLELLRDERARKDLERRRGMLLGGALTAAVGLGLIALLAALPTGVSVWTVGLIPLLIGAALFLFGLYGMGQPAAPSGAERAPAGIGEP